MDHNKALAALRAVLLFHDSKNWDEAKRLYWLRLTGTTEATTRTLCDTVRAALGATEHVVQPGETLSGIATKYIGDAQRWHELWGENSNMIGPNPDLIHPHMVLRLPRAWCNETAHKSC